MDMVDAPAERPRMDRLATSASMYLEPIPLIADPAVQQWKRVVDLLVTVAALPLVLPLCAIIALAVKIDSSGPILFTQTRLGRGGSTFELVKFRTMHENSEEALQTILENDPELREEYERFHKLSDDPRVTPLGRYLRRFSLDELPQVWNILVGDMTLVGPRAYTPEELPEMNGAEEMILRIRPGLTGFWQVGGRNDVSFAERVSMDLFYLANWSVGWDLYLLLCTVRIVVFETRAY